MQSVTLIPGDGVGPEITAAVRAVLSEVTVEIEWEEVEAGETAFKRTGSPLPDEVISSLSRTRLGLKGPLTNPGKDYPSPNRELRKAIGLWCNVRVGQAFDGVRTRFPGASLAVIRDTTEDLGSTADHFLGPDVGVAIKFTTRAATQRLARFAFDYAVRHGYHNIVIPHHAAILRTTDGMFLSVVMDEAKLHPELDVKPEFIDGVLMHLVQDPTEYELLLTNNFYGGFLAGIAAGLTGGIGLMAGANLGDDGAALFEPAHGTAPKYVGQDKVNPTAMVLSGALLLDHIGLVDEAKAVRQAVRGVMAERQCLTYDQGGFASTNEVALAFVRHLERPSQVGTGAGDT